MDYAFYQQYWWFIVSLLGSILVFLLFVQGGQTLLYSIGKTELERLMIINTLGRKWEFTFTTLVTFGGAMFASFPLFYSTSFSGAYWLWMLLLFCFIIQAVSYEFRTKSRNILGQKTYEIFLMINGYGGTVILGVAVATFFTGADFIVNKSNLTNPLMPVISTWENPLHGLESFLNIKNLLLGACLLFLARTLGLLYFIRTIHDEKIVARSRKKLPVNVCLFLALFLSFTGLILFGKGYAVHPVSQEISIEQSKYFENLLNMPVVLMLMAAGILAILYGILRTFIQKHYLNGFWITGAGSVATVLCLLLLAGWNHTAYYPSTADLQSSLTLSNSSSSLFTLQVMSVVSLIIPFVLWYIIKAWRAVSHSSIDEKEMQEKGHKY
jgi:cytochrome bd ubiquinol oxidase subunit II